MVGAGLVVGLATGGFPAAYSTGVQQLSLIVAMTFSLTEISFRGIQLRPELGGLVLAFLMSYGVLGGLIVLFGAATTDPALRSGWMLMAAVPPAVAVVPVTSLLRGDVRRSLISEAILYALGLLVVPALSVLLLGEGVPIEGLALQTLLLIGLPIVASRPLRLWSRVGEARPTAVSLSFFFLVLAIAGSTRDTLLGRTDLVGGLLALGCLRTFGLGLLLFAITHALRVPRDRRTGILAFGGLKNLGLTVVLASTLVGPLASLPAIASLIFETAWLGTLPLLFRSNRIGPAAAR